MKQPLCELNETKQNKCFTQTHAASMKVLSNSQVQCLPDGHSDPLL